MNHGSELLKELGELQPRKVFFRTYNLENSGDGTPALKWGSTNAYTEDASGKLVYNRTILDSIFDSYLENGVKSYAQIGFMPEALSVNLVPYKHCFDPAQKYNNIFNSWAFPPKDYKKWKDLVYKWVKHCLDRYGREEVEKWYWETWNEPNIGYWSATRQEFLRLHDHAVNGVLRALPTKKISLSLENLPVSKGKATLSSYLVDKTNGNAFIKWLEIGSPQSLSIKQFQEL